MAVDRYRIIRDGQADPDVILWDGVTKFTPPGGGTLVKESAWTGPIRSSAINVTDQNRRTVEQALDVALADLTAAQGVLAGTPTNAQTLAAVRLLVRTVKGLVRLQLGALDAAD